MKKLKLSRRGISTKHVELCIRHGTRTNVPWDGGCFEWNVKFMFAGLHVVLNPRNGDLIDAHWTRSDSVAALSDFETCTKNIIGKA